MNYQMVLRALEDYGVLEQTPTRGGLRDRLEAMRLAATDEDEDAGAADQVRTRDDESPTG